MKTILFSILLLFSINGVAHNWKKVAKNKDGSSFYIDGDNMKKHNRLVYFWELSDFLEPLSGGVNSAISKYKVDCTEEKQTHLNLTFYSQSMSKGRILYEFSPNKIEYPKPKEIGYIVMKFACDNAR
ncbi:MAG: hypothetical protein CMK54_05905 [Proteobacteria bacterium]|nr:hypothetical protein [Pseudomonadota bacterium]